MRELDQLLEGYLARRYESADPEEKAAFRALLQLSDPELGAYLLGRTPPGPEFAEVVRHIRDRTGS